MISVFISGLKRRTGKSLVSAGIAGTMQGLAYDVSYYKPIQTGAKNENGIITSQDLTLIKYVDCNIKVSSTYAFQQTLSPIVSAYESSTKIDLTKLHTDFQLNIQMRECHIVEGSNSISTPIDESHTELDLVKKLGTPLVMVINPKASTIDEIISGLTYVKNSKVKCYGVILTDYDTNSSSMEEKYLPQLIKNFTSYETLGVIPHYNDLRELTPETLIADTLNGIELERVFNSQISKL